MSAPEFADPRQVAPPGRRATPTPSDFVLELLADPLAMLGPDGFVLITGGHGVVVGLLGADGKIAEVSGRGATVDEAFNAAVASEDRAERARGPRARPRGRQGAQVARARRRRA